LILIQQLKNSLQEKCLLEGVKFIEIVQIICWLELLIFVKNTFFFLEDFIVKILISKELTIHAYGLFTKHGFGFFAERNTKNGYHFYSFFACVIFLFSRFS